MLTLVNADGSTPDGSLLDEIVREGAKRMLAAALEAEVNTYLAELSGERDEDGRRLVVRNGYHEARQVATSAGAVLVKAPRVNDRRVDEESGERRRFSSVILPPWCRKSPKISEVLPLLYLHGLSTGDFVPALEQFLGSAAGLSPATVSRLTATWQADHTQFQQRDLSTVDYVYVWADGVHLKVRLDQTKAAVLVLIGVRADGTKELIALEDGYRESTESWASLLRDVARRGMRAPVLAVGDGALGFWNALREVFPDTRHQRCWVHKTVNVLDALPSAAQPGAKKAIAGASVLRVVAIHGDVVDLYANSRAGLPYPPPYLRYNLATGDYSHLVTTGSMEVNGTNAAGWAVGWAVIGSADAAVVHAPAYGMVKLPTMFKYAPHAHAEPTTISDDGRIIAGSDNDRSGTMRAVIWTCHPR